MHQKRKKLINFTQEIINKLEAKVTPQTAPADLVQPVLSAASEINTISEDAKTTLEYEPKPKEDNQTNQPDTNTTSVNSSNNNDNSESTNSNNNNEQTTPQTSSSSSTANLEKPNFVEENETKIVKEESTQIAATSPSGSPAPASSSSSSPAPITNESTATTITQK